MWRFLFGAPCARCSRGSGCWSTERYSRYDGTGSWRMRTWGRWPDAYESHYCDRNGWFSRHWIVTSALVLVTVGAVAMAISSLLGA